MVPTAPPRRLPALWPYLVVCAAVGVLVSFGARLHLQHHSDSLTPVLVSLQRWTFFMWDQDRIGMLVPLLALPLRHPLANLLFQDAIYIFAALAAMFLLPRYMLRDDSYPFAGTLSAAAFLALAPVAWCHDFTCNTFYGVWLALGLGGLVLAERPREQRVSWLRLLAGLGLLVLAHWVYSAAALVLGPLVLARFLLCAERQSQLPLEPITQKPSWLRRVRRAEVTTELLLLGMAFGIGYALMCLVEADYPTNLGTLPAREWPQVWQRLLRNQWGYLAPQRWPLFLVGAALFGMSCLKGPAVRRQLARAWRAALALAAAAAVFGLFMGTRQWMLVSHCHPRYTHPSVFLLQGAPALIAVAPLGTVLSQGCRRVLYVLAPLALFLAAVVHYHCPSLQRVRADLDRALGSCTAEVLATRCTHVAGDYWFAWPVVFHANLALHEANENRTVWAIAPRGRDTRAQWEQMPIEEMRVAIPADGLAKAAPFLAWLQLPPMEVVEKRATIWVLRPRAVVSAEPVHRFTTDAASGAACPRRPGTPTAGTSRAARFPSHEDLFSLPRLP